MENDNTSLDSSAISDRLFEIIASMHETEKRDLLEVLEIVHTSKPTERRKHIRKAPLTNMGYLMHEVILKDCIQNLSQTGAYIETKYSFRVGQKLSMAVRIADSKAPVQLDGTIVRVDPNGVAVTFDNAIPEF